MNSMTRRGAIASAAGAVTGASTTMAHGAAAPAKAHANHDAPDATALAQMIRAKRISAAEAVDAAIKRAEAAQPKLNFLVTPMYERARAEAKAGGQTGPFAGVPFLVKDLNDVKGVPTHDGSRAMLKAPPAKTQDAYIDAFQKAGLIFIGKSATPEYGFLPTTEPVAFGPTHNPWNLARSSGGSSGGSAAAVAAGVVPFAHANDGGGSIRIPSANCGLFGLKPSRGRMIASGTGPDIGPIDLAVEHCVTRSVRDSAALFAATERADAGAPLPPIGLVTAPVARKLRVGLVIDTMLGAAPDPEVRAGAENAAKLMETLGHHVEPTRWPTDGQAFARDFLILWASGAAALVEEVGKAIGRKPDDTVLEPFTLAMAEMIHTLPPGGLEAAVANLQAAGRGYDGWFDRYDVIVSPVLGKPPAPLGWVAPTVPIPELTERLNAYVGYTTLHNVAGAPAISVPLHWTADGLPVGVQFAARAGQEKLLFELAYQLEKAQPWGARRPPVWFG